MSDRDLTPEDALKRLRDVACCSGNHEMMTSFALYGASNGCPSCALLLVQAIEGPAIWRCADLAGQRYAFNLEKEIRALSGGPR